MSRNPLMRRSRRSETAAGIDQIAQAVRVLAAAVGSDQMTDGQKLQLLSNAIQKLSTAWTVPALERAFAEGMRAAALDLASLTPQQLRDKRRKARLTQAQLAKMLGVQQANIAAWETEKEAIPAKHIPSILQILFVQGINAVGSLNPPATL
jgi:DNA-binding transcriptional regulator YiaG